MGVVRGKREKYSIIEPVYLLVCLIIRKQMLNIMERMIHMKKKVAVILVAMLAALTVGTAVTLASCQNPQQSEKVQSSSVSDSSTESGAEESPEASEESVVSEETSAESKTESSKESKTESSEDSKAESSKESKGESSQESKSSNTSNASTEKKTTQQNKPKITATSVTLDINNLNLTAGGSRELNAYVHYSDGSSNYSGITWSSSNTGVATVDGYGNVYAHSAGTARITASYGSFKASCSVTVKAAQQSKPKTQTPTTSNINNSGGNSGGSSSNKGGSGNKGGSTTKKQTNTNNSGGNSGGSTTTKKQTNKGGNGGGNTKTKKQQTASKWKASDHEKDKVYSTGG